MFYPDFDLLPQNPIIVQGFGAFGQGYFPFEGLPAGISDPSNKLIYAFHPFFGDGDADRMDWDNVFGNFASNRAFIVTAWGAHTKEDWCPIWGVSKLIDFTGYLDDRDIGLMGYALDIPYSMINHFTNTIVRVKTLGSSCSSWGSAGSVMTNYVASSRIDTTPPSIICLFFIKINMV